MAGFEYARTGDIGPKRKMLDEIIASNPGPATERELLDELFGVAAIEENVAEMERLMPLFPTASNLESRLNEIERQMSVAEGKGESDKVRELALNAVSLLEKELREMVDPRGLKRAARLGSLAVYRAAAGQKEQAVADAKKGCELAPREKDYFWALARQLELAQVYALLGENSAALDLLEQLTNEPFGITYGGLLHDSFWTSLRGDPRFQAILARMAPKDTVKK